MLGTGGFYILGHYLDPFQSSGKKCIEVEKK
jgi:hypothetical protein